MCGGWFMARIKDFKPKYVPKILAIDPAFSFKSTGCGVAIINKHPQCFGGPAKKPIVHRTMVIQPFSSESSLRNMIELANRTKDIWLEDEGYSSFPESIVIERPVIYPGSPVAPMTLMDLTLFVGALTQIVNCEEILLPTPREWKANQQKAETKDEIDSLCDSYSKKNIIRDLESIALHKRHNAYDAIGLGIYAIKVQIGQLPRPRMYYYKTAA
jgi:hypothetical protein